MTEYLIFHYSIDEQEYVEAYPRHGDVQAWVPSNEILAHAIVSAPSRNQARKAAYTNWIRADGKGFNQLPYRAYVEDR